jgi:magnesium-transporting ATPase (P-type)
MIDLPRAEAIVAVRHCREAGIAVKMITGDHALTARSIAEQLRLHGGNEQLIAITGRELETISEAGLPDLIERAAVFARVAPEQKLRLVQAFQAPSHRGHDRRRCERRAGIEPGRHRHRNGARRH